MKIPKLVPRKCPIDNVSHEILGEVEVIKWKPVWRSNNSHTPCLWGKIHCLCKTLRQKYPWSNKLPRYVKN